MSPPARLESLESRRLLSASPTSEAVFIEESAIAYEVSLDESTPVDLRLEQLTTASAAATAFVEADLPLTEETVAAFTQLLAAMVSLLSVETETTPVMQQQVKEVATAVSVTASEAVGSLFTNESGGGDGAGGGEGGSGGTGYQFNNVPVPPPPPRVPTDPEGNPLPMTSELRARIMFQWGAHHLGNALNAEGAERDRLFRQAGSAFNEAFEQYFSGADPDDDGGFDLDPDDPNQI